MNITSNTIIERKASLPLMDLPKDQLVFNDFGGNADSFSSCPDILKNIFWQCVNSGDKTILLKLRTLNKFHHIMVTEFANQKIDLGQFFAHCGNVEFLDKQAFHLASVLPKILSTNFDWLNHVENGAGGVAFYYEELTMDELVAWGQQIGVEVHLWEKILVEDRLLPKEESQICIISKGIFKGSLGKKPQELKHLVENDLGCQMLTARKAIYFALRMIEMSNGKTVVFGQKPWTFTSTSTPYENEADVSFFVVVGGNSPSRVGVSRSILGSVGDGVGGLQKF